MKISAELYRRILSELSRYGIQLGEAPVLQLATSPEVMQRLETAVPNILSAIEDDKRQEAEKFLRTLIESAKKVARGLNGELQEFKNAVLSLFSSYLSNWEIDKHILRNLATVIPEVYIDKKHVYLVTDESEASTVVSLYPETVKNIVGEYVKRSIKSLDISGRVCRIDVLGLEFTVYRISNVISLLYKLSITDKANEILVNAIRNSLSNLKTFADVRNPSHDTIVIELNPAEVYLGNIDRSIVEGASIRIVGRLRYTDNSGVSDAYIEMSSPALGIIRIPAYGFSIENTEAPVRFVTNAVDNLRIFLAKYSPVLLAVNEEARKYGFEMRAATSPEAVYKAAYTKEIEEMSATVEVTVKELTTTMTGEIVARIKDAKKLKDRLNEMLSQYDYYHPSLSISGDTVKLRFETPIGELRPEIFSVLNTLIQDLKMISHSVATDVKPLNHLALFTTLTALGAKNPLEASAKFANLTQTELIAQMRVVLAAKNLDADPEVFVSEPGKVVSMLVDSEELTVDRYLEPVLMGKKIRDLLAPFTEFTAHYNLDVVTTALSSYIAKSFYARKDSTILERLAGNDVLTPDIVHKYIEELGGPMNLRTLLLPVQGGERLWDVMTPDLKYRALLLMEPGEIKAFGRVEAFANAPDAKKVEDRLLIAEAYCEKTAPPACTEFILTEYPDLVPIPKTAKIVEDAGAKWIEVGIYRLQIEKFRRDGIQFRVFDRIAGSTYRVRAYNVREAVKKVSIGEDVEVITA